MNNMVTTLEKINGKPIKTNLHSKGYAVVSEVLSEEQCVSLRQLYEHHPRFRRTVVLERYRFGRGEYKYFDYPLPKLIHTIREATYPALAPVANEWMTRLNIDRRFPVTLSELLAQCHENHQHEATPLILKYGAGGFNTLHQDLYGTVFFPLQVVLFLSEPGVDYTGGEFVLTEQMPRAQSRATVLRPHRGDMLIFTTNFRPVKGTRGYYRATVKHGVSELHGGERYTVGIPFHDATH